MTAISVAPTDLYSSLIGDLDELHALLDRLNGLDLEGLSDQDLETLLKGAAQAEAKLACVRTRALRAADASKAASRAGAATTDAWAANLLKVDGAPMARQMKLAARLGDHAATQDALAGGRISAEKAAIIVDADAQLPAGLTAPERDRVEAHLLAQAPFLTPRRLRQVARRALEAVRPREMVDSHENQLIANEEIGALSRVRLTFHDNADGTLTGHFTVPALAGGILKKVLDSMCAPRRQAIRDQALDDGVIDWSHLRGMAFVELLEHVPTDHLHGAVASTVIVTVNHDSLIRAVRAARTDLDVRISAGEARRLACNAGILPVVLDGSSVPIDVARSRRLFNEPQRVALATRHSTCAAEGCERPYAWCELHHRRPWSAGGPTDMKNAVPLCGWHHRQIHQHPERVKIRRT